MSSSIASISRLLQTASDNALQQLTHAANYLGGDLTPLLSGSTSLESLFFDRLKDTAPLSAAIVNLGYGLGHIVRIKAPENDGAAFKAMQLAIQTRKAPEARSLYALFEVISGGKVLLTTTGPEAMPARKAFFHALNQKKLNERLASLEVPPSPGYIVTHAELIQEAVISFFCEHFYGCPVTKGLRKELETIDGSFSSIIAMALPKKLLGLVPSVRQAKDRFSKAVVEFFDDKTVREQLHQSMNSGSPSWLAQVVKKHLPRGITLHGLNRQQRQSLSSQSEVRSAIVSIFPLFNLAQVIWGMTYSLNNFSNNPLVQQLKKELAKGKLSQGGKDVIQAIIQHSLLRYSQFNVIPRYTSEAIPEYGIPAKSIILNEVNAYPLLDNDDYSSAFEVFLTTPSYRCIKLAQKPDNNLLEAAYPRYPVFCHFAEDNGEKHYYKLRQINGETVPIEICKSRLSKDLIAVFESLHVGDETDIAADKLPHHLLPYDTYGLADVFLKEKTSAKAILPFGAGRRRCPAETAVLQIMQTFLTRLIRPGPKQISPTHFFNDCQSLNASDKAVLGKTPKPSSTGESPCSLSNRPLG